MASRARVLSAFRELHRMCQTVFAGDAEALAAGRLKINTEFRGNKDETDPDKIEKLIQVASDSSSLLRQTVVQGKLTNDGSTYELRITKDTCLENNTLFDPNADIPVKPQRRRKAKCGESSASDTQPTAKKS